MSLTGAAVGGVVALTGMGVAHLVQYPGSRSTAAVATPDVLSTACEEGLRLTASRCGCDRLNPGSSASIKTREVHLDLFLIYTVPKNKLLPSWSWTTHWAIEVDGIFYELCRDRGYSAAQNRFKLEHRTMAERKQTGRRERHAPVLHLPMGITHLSDEQLTRIGEAHADGYRWDPLIRNCQTFLHEAYFGKPMLNPLRKKQEIRCSEHGPLRPMPTFTMITLSSIFGSVYLLEQGVEWYFHLTMSPATLILRCVPVLIGLSYFIPAALATFKSICWSQREEVGKSIRQKLQSVVAWVPLSQAVRAAAPSNIRGIHTRPVAADT